MAAIDKIKKARGLDSRAPETPPGPNPTPPLQSDPSAALSAPLRELLPLLRGLLAALPELRSQMGAWPQAISDRTAATWRTIQQQAEAQRSEEALTLLQERAAWGQETGQVLQLLQAQAGGWKSSCCARSGKNRGFCGA